MFVGITELNEGITNIALSPKNVGRVDMIVCRPATGKRQVLELAQLDVNLGLVGDNWLKKGFKKSINGAAHPDMQLNIMNSRCIQLLAKSKERWALAGDQFYVDLDLSKNNLPPGTLLKIGTAKIEITSEPHLGCKKFMDRYGKDAVTFVNSDVGKLMNLRGVNARIRVAGVVKVGDSIEKMSC